IRKGRSPAWERPPPHCRPVFRWFRGEGYLLDSAGCRIPVHMPLAIFDSRSIHSPCHEVRISACRTRTGNEAPSHLRVVEGQRKSIHEIRGEWPETVSLFKRPPAPEPHEQFLREGIPSNRLKYEVAVIGGRVKELRDEFS